MSEKENLISVLEKQDLVLDKMLAEQLKIHDFVLNREWVMLEDSINKVSILTDEFVSLDAQRESIAGLDSLLYKNSDVSDKLFSVRTKLSKSKIENQALGSYVNASKKFISGILDRCIPQQRNALYTSKGYIKKPGASSLIVNTVF